MMLELTVFYSNGIDGLSGYSSRWVLPRTLAVNTGPNQQFRVDLLAPTAAADSMAERDILATIFETTPDDPARWDPLRSVTTSRRGRGRRSGSAWPRHSTRA